MSSTTPPEITLELTGGSLTIRTPQATYRVVVAGQPAQGPPQPLPPSPPHQALPDAPPPPPPPPPPPAQEAADDWDADLDEEFSGKPSSSDEEFYRELSHDMYREVGRLARRLSMSIRDVEQLEMGEMDLESAGRQLEHAKDELEDVVRMTEKATMRIMDLGEEIQQAISRARELTKKMEGEGGEGTEGASPQELEEIAQGLRKRLEELGSFLEGLGGEELKSLAEKAKAVAEGLKKAPAGPSAQPSQPSKRYSFPLDVVFQTVYELCTNDAVKKHIKAMWDAKDKAFDAAVVEQMLNEIAPDEPDADNFLNIDLKGVLKALFKATKSERFQQILKKMAATSDQIFLDQTLPLEAIPASDQPQPQAQEESPGPDPKLLEQAEALVKELEQLVAKSSPPVDPREISKEIEKLLEAAKAAQEAGAGAVDPQVLKELGETLDQIYKSVTSIIESLSFQDLSGQAIYRIVRLLTDFQVQLLAMVVSFGSKLKAKETMAEITPEETEKLAQQEVDKVLAQVKAKEEGEEGEPAKLDQEAVNKLLESLGF